MVLLPLMLIMIRNFFGVISVVATMAIIFGVSLYTSAAVQGAFGYLVTWFLMLGGVRAVLELQGSRRRGAAPNSDADQVGRLTHLPAVMWVGFFAAISVISLVIGGRWLLEVALVN
jgi:hypothetical protein